MSELRTGEFEEFLFTGLPVPGALPAERRGQVPLVVELDEAAIRQDFRPVRFPLSVLADAEQPAEITDGAEALK